MGFNPFRKQRKTAFDVVMVVATIVIAAALVVWAVVG